MVRKVVLSQYTSDPPEEAERTKIPGGPLYALGAVAALAEQLQILLWTTRCIAKVRDLYELMRHEYDSELEMVARLLTSLHTARYIDSEWCDNGKGGLAACDAYEVRVEETLATTGRTQKTAYFIKFALSKTGQIVLVASCHV